VGTLGPRYEVTYTVPGGPNGESSLRQELYPYAARGPVTYMAPDQKFWGSQYTPGGWSLGTLQLRKALVKAGLPLHAPESRAHAQRTIGVGIGAGAGIALAAVALGLLNRKRLRSTPS
jgi:hypothetical protein